MCAFSQVHEKILGILVFSKSAHPRSLPRLFEIFQQAIRHKIVLTSLHFEENSQINEGNRITISTLATKPMLMKNEGDKKPLSQLLDREKRLDLLLKILVSIKKLSRSLSPYLTPPRSRREGGGILIDAIIHSTGWVNLNYRRSEDQAALMNEKGDPCDEKNLIRDTDAREGGGESHDY